MRSLRLVPLLLAAGCADAASPAAAPAAPVAPSPAPAEAPRTPAPSAEEVDRPDLGFDNPGGPVDQRTLVEKSWFRTNFAADGETIRFHDLRPFLVAEVLPSSLDPESSAAPPNYDRVLRGVVDSVMRFFREAASTELPRIQSLEDERLRWLVFADRRGFETWQSRMGKVVSDAAYLEKGGDGLVIAHRDDLPDRDLAWLAAAQSIACWKRHLCQQDDDAMADAKGLPRDPVTRDDRRLQSAFAWLDRGLQSWFAGGRATDGLEPVWTPGQPADAEYALVREARKRHTLWPLEDFLFADAPQLRSRVKIKEGGNAADRMTRLHAAQSRLLVDTLLEGEGGRWREGFGALLRKEIRGVSGKVYLLEAFGLPRRSDSPEVKRWIAELEKACLARLDATAPK
ncbi:MAG TPA: hypothetical protein VFS92_04900 [Planctomycetota bacterium]|nr:hypothetical protein [Planctomycetota bacterium]